jgi:hypothetical protein
MHRLDHPLGFLLCSRRDRDWHYCIAVLAHLHLLDPQINHRSCWRHNVHSEEEVIGAVLHYLDWPVKKCEDGCTSTVFLELVCREVH